MLKNRLPGSQNGGIHRSIRGQTSHVLPKTMTHLEFFGWSLVLGCSGTISMIILDALDIAKTRPLVRFAPFLLAPALLWPFIR